MAVIISATDVAIARALKSSTLWMEQRRSMFTNSTYVAICDGHGIIEVHLDWAGADARIKAIEDRVRC
jgi:hypothetical protein